MINQILTVVIAAALSLGDAERDQDGHNLGLMYGPAVAVLDQTGDCAFTVAGNLQFQAFDGLLQVNSNSASAFCSSGAPTVSFPELYIVGGANLSEGTFVNGNLQVGAVPRADPLVALSAPPQGPDRGTPVALGNVNLLPGWYPYGIRRSGGSASCASGVYYIGGAGGNQNGLDLGGGAFTCNECTFYIAEGGVHINANAAVVISAPQSGTYWHVPIFQSRNNQTMGVISFGANSSLSGTLYFPQNLITVVGVQGFLQIISFRLNLAGNAPMNVFYDGAFPFCIADVSPPGGDGAVNVADLLTVINQWGSCGNCAADLVHDGTVDVSDLLAVINHWGSCY